MQCHRFQGVWFGNGTDAYRPLSQQPRGPGTFLGVGPTWLPPCPHHHQHCHHSHDRHNEHQNTGVPETEGRVLENKSKSGKSWQKDSPHGMNNRRIQKDLRRNFRKIHLLEWYKSVFLEGFRRILAVFACYTEPNRAFYLIVLLPSNLCQLVDLNSRFWFGLVMTWLLNPRAMNCNDQKIWTTFSSHFLKNI